MSRDTAHPGATCWVTRPLLRIDYAFLSPALAAHHDDPPSSLTGLAAKAPLAGGAFVRGYQRMDDDASDHFAVVVDLALRGGAAAPPAQLELYDNN
jgi:hypothetical protein